MPGKCKACREGGAQGTSRLGLKKFQSIQLADRGTSHQRAVPSRPSMRLPRHTYTSSHTLHHTSSSFPPPSHITTTTSPTRTWCTNSTPLTIPPRLPLSGLPLRATSVGARTVSTLPKSSVSSSRQITSPHRLPALPSSGSLNRLLTGRPGPSYSKISCTALTTGFSLLGLARLTLAPRARAPLGYGHITRFMPSSNATANYHSQSQSQSQSQSRPRSPPPPPSSRSLASRLDPAPTASGHFASSSRAFRSAASAIRPSSSSGPSGSYRSHYDDRSVSSSAAQSQPRKRTHAEPASHGSDAHEHQHKKMRRHPRRPAKNGRGGGGKPPPPPLQQLEPPLLNREEILRRFPVTLKQQWEENPKAPLANYLGGGSGGAQNLGEGGKGFVVTEGSVNGQKVFR